jgi:hypothetical protein
MPDADYVPEDDAATCEELLTLVAVPQETIDSLVDHLMDLGYSEEELLTAAA